MKRVVIALSAISLSVVFFGALAAQEKKEKKFEATCVVSGQPAKEGSSVEFRGGKKVYFCCDNCPKAYKADPKKFAANAHHQLLQTGQITQVACPLTGKEINASTAIDVKGVKVAFCCNNCKGKAAKSDDAVALLFKDIEKGFTLQTACPVSGKDIDVTKTVLEHKGKKIYFCCDNCPKAFKADPSKYEAKLPQLQEEKKS